MTSILQPSSESEVVEAVCDAAASQMPLEIRGGGTRLQLGRPVQASRTLAMDQLSGVSLYEPGALTAVVKAGTPLSELEAQLAAENQRLPFEPMDHRALLGSLGEPTIGGIVASGVSGPRRIQAGACRDSVLGVRFVNGEGAVVKNGGRVMKNVTGYDLSKLMTGAYGTLGVLTEVSLKVLPIPETTATLVYKGLDDRAAVKLMADAVGSPFEITGAAHLPHAADGPQTLLRIEGFESQVSYRVPKLRQRLENSAAVELVMSAEADALWQAVRDVTTFAGGDRAVWEVSAKPSDGPDVVEAIGREREVAAYYDWAGGRIWLATPEDGDAGASIVRGAVDAVGGHATLVRAPSSVKAAIDVFHPQQPRLARLASDLRAKFDPVGILNPGRLAS
ncbi:MAG: glycolate oxidase subunit GlcE [Pseudomonadota bacterium]